jgi:DNA-binding SARP family transcriptional activator/tetratricopeptide (TPR) repeat protein
MATLHVRLLGGFVITYDDQVVTSVNTARLQSLLAYLVLHRDTPQSRQHVAFVLWPDSTEEQARTNLRKVLSQLRQVWPAIEDFVNTEGQTLQWPTSSLWSSDVSEFEEAVASEGFERAVALYRGDLLPDCYDEWIRPKREHLSQQFVGAANKAIAVLENRREYRAAITQAQRLLQHDRLNEATYRTLMRLLALNDDRASALYTYQTCQQILKREFSIEPGDETRELHERLLHSETFAPSEPATAHTIPLVGRVAEWQQLLKAWERTATASEPQCVVIEGEAGIGKTRLAEELIEWANRQGIATATARCYAAEGALAYAPVTAWLRTGLIGKSMARLDDVWLTEVARVLPEMLTEDPELPPPSQLTEGWQRQRLFESLARAVLSSDAPLLLLLDDVQWGDQDTLEWLRFLLRFNPQARSRLMLVGTVRSEEVGDDHPLHAFQEMTQREGNLTLIELGPLNAIETAALATQVAGQAPPSDHLAHLYRETEGNPLFVVETMRFQSAAVPSKGEREPVPSSIHAVIAHRLNQLTPDARDVTRLAATIGREFTLDVLAQAGEYSQDALVRNMDELLHRRVIREHVGAKGNSTYDFSHDKIREAVYRSLSNARRQLCHRRVADALEHIYEGNLDAASGQIAAHYELAGLSEQAIHHYQLAAKASRNIYANADAIRHYRRAQTLLDSLADRKPHLAASSLDLQESLGDVLHHITQHEDARAAFQRALVNTTIASPRDLARLHCKIGNTFRDQRHYQEAIQAYKAAEGSLDDQEYADSGPDYWREWIQVQLELDSSYYWMGQMIESGELLKRLQPIIERRGTPSQRAEFFRSLAFRKFRQNRSVSTDEIVAYTKAAADALVAAGDHAHIPAATFGVGFALLWHGKPAQAEQPILDALRMAERTGDTSLIARCVTYLTIVYRQLGQVEQVQGCVARSLEAADAANMPEYTAQAKANTAWVAWRNGDWHEVHTNGHMAMALWGQIEAGHASVPFQWTALFPLMAAALNTGDVAQAAGHAGALLHPSLQRLPNELTNVLEQAILAWRTDQPENARALLYQSIDLAQQLRFL